MKVVKAAHRLPGTVKCSCCGSELEFTYDDVQFDTITYGRWDSETTRNYIECPICKSKNNVRRISSLDRGVSVAMVGLASSKIGKQYECTRCRHKF